MACHMSLYLFLYMFCILPFSLSFRLDAVECLMEASSAVADARDSLKQLPDLQRLLGK